MSVSDMEKPYPQVKSQYNIKEVEEHVLDFWDQDGTFLQSVEMRPKKREDGANNEFVFYDGPPFANGNPHYGHLLTGFVKDVVPRYFTMKGFRVERRFGWDCHGLPAEMVAEKELGVSGRKEVVELGVEKFNSHCRSLVLRTTDIFEKFVRRQARWVDMQNDYKTMDLFYMESVIYAFKRLYELGLAYEGFRVLPYCWECETPLSNFETRQDDAYRSRKDPAVTVRFKAIDANQIVGASGNIYFLAWTTTPWTLPSNLALCVNDHINYAVLHSDKSGESYILASSLVDKYKELFENYEVIKELPGSSLVNMRYEPLFNYFVDLKNVHKVLSADFVNVEEGTGIVHLAPGFGEDDQNVCEKNGIGVVCPVDERGRFTEVVKDYADLQVFDANEKIISSLKKQGNLISHEIYEHQYPHCWRTDTPLIYKAVSSWFVNVTAIKQKLIELNKEINWIPAHIRDGAFGKWLEGARDWSISRNRFWGAPIPVWKSDNPEYPRVDVYGSLDEIERDFGIRPADLHKPFIDELTRPNPDDPTGKSTMRRIEDVLDCWFESGSMPFAQVHFPFENEQWFLDHYPADFIVEYVAQTRGWFYTLHVIGCALFDRPPFKTSVTHGVVLGNDGRKLSKRLKNFPDPEELFDKYGADAIRWFFMQSAVLKGQDIVIEESGPKDAVKQIINPIWNSYYFLTLYGNVDGIKGKYKLNYEGVLENYIVAKTSQLCREVDDSLSKYDFSTACEATQKYLDVLTNWFIRRSRDKFWAPKGGSDHQKEKQEAFDALHTCLVLLSKILAPLLPLLTEHIYKGLSGDRSVHLTDWPKDNELKYDDKLVSSMDLVREVCSNAHAIRKANSLRARLPLQAIYISASAKEKLIDFEWLIKEEINVKSVVYQKDLSSYVQQKIEIFPARLGPRYKENAQMLITKLKSGQFSVDDDGSVIVEGIKLASDEAQMTMTPVDPKIARILDDQVVIALDTKPTHELLLEGLARDIIRVIQQARKDANLVVTDRIEVEIAPLNKGDEIRQAVMQYGDEISRQVLCPDGPRLIMSDPTKAETGYETRAPLPGGQEIILRIRKIANN